jgi:hypothetical protein
VNASQAFFSEEKNQKTSTTGSAEGSCRAAAANLFKSKVFSFLPCLSCIPQSKLGHHVLLAV